MEIEDLKFFVRREQGHGECSYGIGLSLDGFGLGPYPLEADVQKVVDALHEAFSSATKEQP